MPRRLNRPCPFNPPESPASRRSSEADTIRTLIYRVVRVAVRDPLGRLVGYRHEGQQMMAEVSWTAIRDNAANMMEAYDELETGARDEHKWRGGEKWDKPKGEKR